jgi:hypothetical protein
MRKNNVLLIVIVMSILLVLSSIVFCIQNASAIGITPGRTTLNFEPLMTRNITFAILNSEHRDMNVVLTLKGELADYIRLPDKIIHFSAGEESKSLQYVVNLPERFEKPGRYEGDVVALEVPNFSNSDLEREGTMIMVGVAVISQLYVYVPYPNKYLDAELNVLEANSNENLKFYVPITNRGKLDIAKAKAYIDIYTSMNSKIASFETDEKSVASLNRDELSAEWAANVTPGKYRAVATITYDGETLNVEKQFSVGQPLIEIESIEVKDFSLGEIAKFNVMASNKWSEEMKDVYITIDVFNNKNEVMAEFKSPVYNIPALSRKEMILYWDTAGVKEGVYDGKLLLKYGDRSAEKNIQIKITANSLTVFGATGKAVSSSKSKLSIETILVSLIVILIIVNVVWFVIIQRILKKRREKLSK